MRPCHILLFTIRALGIQFLQKLQILLSSLCTASLFVIKVQVLFLDCSCTGQTVVRHDLREELQRRFSVGETAIIICRHLMPSAIDTRIRKSARVLVQSSDLTIDGIILEGCCVVLIRILGAKAVNLGDNVSKSSWLNHNSNYTIASKPM